MCVFVGWMERGFTVTPFLTDLGEEQHTQCWVIYFQFTNIVTAFWSQRHTQDLNSALVLFIRRQCPNIWKWKVTGGQW